jgi:hypothetical protein
MIAMWSALRTVYQRKDGSFYWVIEGHRQDLTRRPDGSFYLKTIGGEPA